MKTAAEWVDEYRQRPVGDKQLREWFAAVQRDALESAMKACSRHYTECNCVDEIHALAASVGDRKGGVSNHADRDVRQGSAVMLKRKKLTGDDWTKVFAAHCQSKQGRPITKEKRALVDAAWTEDEARYKAMGKDVFNATAPFGSTRRWK